MNVAVKIAVKDQFRSRFGDQFLCERLESDRRPHEVGTPCVKEFLGNRFLPDPIGRLSNGGLPGLHEQLFDKLLHGPKILERQLVCPLLCKPYASDEAGFSLLPQPAAPHAEAFCSPVRVRSPRKSHQDEAPRPGR